MRALSDYRPVRSPFKSKTRVSTYPVGSVSTPQVVSGGGATLPLWLSWFVHTPSRLGDADLEEASTPLIHAKWAADAFADAPRLRRIRRVDRHG